MHIVAHVLAQRLAPVPLRGDMLGRRAAVLGHSVPGGAGGTAPRPAGVFGIWISLEPAVAALVGLVLLSEALIARQWLAIALVVIASAGAARSAASARQSPDELPPPPAG